MNGMLKPSTASSTPMAVVATLTLTSAPSSSSKRSKRRRGTSPRLPDLPFQCGLPCSFRPEGGTDGGTASHRFTPCPLSLTVHQKATQRHLFVVYGSSNPCVVTSRPPPFLSSTFFIQSHVHPLPLLLINKDCTRTLACTQTELL